MSKCTGGEFPSMDVAKLCLAKLDFLDVQWTAKKQEYIDNIRASMSFRWSRKRHDMTDAEIIAGLEKENSLDSAYKWDRSLSYSPALRLATKIGDFATASILANGKDAKMWLSADDFDLLHKGIFGNKFKYRLGGEPPIE